MKKKQWDELRGTLGEGLSICARGHYVYDREFCPVCMAVTRTPERLPTQGSMFAQGEDEAEFYSRYDRVTQQQQSCRYRFVRPVLEGLAKPFVFLWRLRKS